MVSHVRFVLFFFLLLCVTFTNAALPNPIYEIDWDVPAELTGQVNMAWSAGVAPRTGIIETTDPVNGGYSVPTGSITFDFPFSLRVGVKLAAVQPGTIGFQRIYEISSGINGYNTVWIGQEGKTGNLRSEIGPYENKYMSTWNGLFTTLSNGQYHDLLIVYHTATTINLYIDGVQQAAPVLATNGNPVANAWFPAVARNLIGIGKSSYAADGYIQGGYDFFEVYNVALSAPQASEAYTEFQTAAANGDPQISGLQGQSYQFHGIPNEYFNLITSPTFQLNSKFVYLASGDCHYNHTTCWSHPGTYLGEVGFMIPSHQVQIIAGSVSDGFSLSIDGHIIKMDHVNMKPYHLSSNNVTMTVHVLSHHRIIISVDLFDITVINADTFFNLMVHFKDAQLLHAGSRHHHYKHHRITSGSGSHAHTDDDDNIYPSAPLHGLIGQTYKNAVYGSNKQLYEGEPDSYLIESHTLFGTDFEFNQFQQ